MLHLYNCAVVICHSFHGHNVLSLWNAQVALMHSHNLVLCTVFVILWAAVWLSDNNVAYINEVTLCQAGLVLRWEIHCLDV